MPKSSQRHFLIKVQGIDGYFQTKTGGGITSTATKVFDGGAEQPDVMASPPEAGNVTVGRAFDPDRDGALASRLKLQVGKFITTVSITATDRNFVATGNATVYSNALLVGFTEPDADSSSGDPAMFELEFAVGAFK